MRGLKVRWDDSEHNPYGALLPLVEAEAPHIVILVDDAHLLPRDLVATLLATLDEHSRNVVATGTAIKLHEDGRLTPPALWPQTSGRKAADRTFPLPAGTVAILSGVLDRSPSRDPSQSRAGVPVHSLGLPELPAVTHRHPSSVAEIARIAKFEGDHAAVIATLGLDLDSSASVGSSGGQLWSGDGTATLQSCIELPSRRCGNTQPWPFRHIVFYRRPRCLSLLLRGLDQHGFPTCSHTGVIPVSTSSGSRTKRNVQHTHGYDGEKELND